MTVSNRKGQFRIFKVKAIVTFSSLNGFSISHCFLHQLKERKGFQTEPAKLHSKIIHSFCLFKIPSKLSLNIIPYLMCFIANHKKNMSYRLPINLYRRIHYTLNSFVGLCYSLRLINKITFFDSLILIFSLYLFSLRIFAKR